MEIPEGNSTKSDIDKMKVLLFGYDSYSYRNKTIIFSIYFMDINENDFPKKITFSVNIIFDYILRILSEKLKKTTTCTLKEKNKLVKYNCEINQAENIDIKNIEINYDFDFGKPYELLVSPLAEFNKDKIINQTTAKISTSNLILFYGDLSLENNYFRVKGKLDENIQINNNNFILNAYTEDYKQINISCEIINNIYNNFEIKCDRDKSTGFNVNNTISDIEQKQLLIIINDGGNDFPKKITFTVNIIFDYILRILTEKSKKTATCTLKEESKLVKYNCEVNQTENIYIKNIEVNYDFDFNRSYEIAVSPLAEYNKDKIINQTTVKLSASNLIFFYGDLSLENNYFRVKGKLDENSQINDNFKLTVYSNDYKQIDISCEIINSIYNNFEIKCARHKSADFNVNNTIGYTEPKQLLIIINDGGNDFVDKKSLDGISKNYFNKGNNKSLSGGVIALIIILPVILITVVLLIIFRKKLFKNQSYIDNNSTIDSKNLFKIAGDNLPKV